MEYQVVIQWILTVIAGLIASYAGHALKSQNDKIGSFDARLRTVEQEQASHVDLSEVQHTVNTAIEPLVHDVREIRTLLIASLKTK